MNLHILVIYLLIAFAAAGCIEHRQERLADNRIGTYVPYCQEENPQLYYQIQCHGSTGFCWCADIESGEKLTESFRYGEKDCMH